MDKIVVTGANGQLGQELKAISSEYNNYDFIFLGRDELDIADSKNVNRVISELKPKYLINCAAYTAVDKAETEAGKAFAINAAGAGNLAAACKGNNAQFVHISTDYVFDGNASTPYTEDSETAPVSVYGKSKLEGEKNVLEVNADAVIIRTSWVYSFYGNNFVKTMLRLMQSKPEIGVVADQYGSPTYAADLAEAIMQIIQQKDWHPGIYHYTNEGLINWCQFAVAIKEVIHSACKVNPITTKEYPTPAARPAYSVLSKERIIKTFDLRLKPWKESLERCLQEFKLQPDAFK